ncbi:MAG TPA: response regulator [Chitinophagales bacterium]|nr:response regulator [Chitinophagales bacterium]
MKAITCLIIDDEELARERLESLLKMHKEIEVLAKIGDPDEAVKEIIYHEPALVFIDVEMPRKSGFDVVKEVREAGFNPTFIFATGYNQYAIKAIKNAAFDYLLKPIDMDDLKETLERFKQQNNLAEKEEKGKYIKECMSSDQSGLNRSFSNVVFAG